MGTNSTITFVLEKSNGNTLTEVAPPSQEPGFKMLKIYPEGARTRQNVTWEPLSDRVFLKSWRQCHS
jgi:hypothetical protein